MQAILLSLVLASTAVQAAVSVTAAEKREFVALLGRLPTKGEFYTEASVTRAQPYLPVLLALTDADIAGHDLYPFLAISRGLCDREANRAYVAEHFDHIRHPDLKLAWAAMLFDAGSALPQIVLYLRGAVDTPEQAAFLSDVLGPAFGQFRARVIAAAVVDPR